MKNENLRSPQGWDDRQINAWHRAMLQKGKTRDYGQIVAALQRLPANTHTLEQYATIPSGGENHPAFCVTVGDLANGNPNILITGGVHGYEPSGVRAAVRFLENDAPRLMDRFNFLVYPCIAPWAYEYDHRWNWQAEDPNKLFSRSAGTKDIAECRHFMDSIDGKGASFACAIDLHETSDRDIELRQMRAERFGMPLAANYRVIPQGYYLILSKMDTKAENAAQLLFGCSIIAAVQNVSPIAPEENVMGRKNRGGIILSPKNDGLMRTYLHRHAERAAVTEVYPDHPAMSPEKSVQAQIASIHGALRYCGPAP